jgi:hypothetical protein
VVWVAGWNMFVIRPDNQQNNQQEDIVAFIPQKVAIK